jgi:DNA-binding MarR family transcriptional regulator
MTSVNPDPHVAQLMAQLFVRIKRESDAAGSSLRGSQLRVLQQLADGGRAITELAERVGMTKQGCGQFVRQLAALGLVDVAPAPSDARVRRVELTDRGRRELDRALAILADLEAGYAAEVGPRRYATFKRVLGEIADVS